MGVFEMIGELFTIDSSFFKGWRYLFSAKYRNEVHRHWRLDGISGSAPGLFYALLLMVAEVLLLFYLVRAVVFGS
jgi:hypothetical protein